MFDCYTLESRAIQTNRQSPAWLHQLRRMAPGEVHPGGRGPILLGDPTDSLPLALDEETWGMPNHWMAAKGLDPFSGRVFFMTMRQALSSGSPPYRRCLIPITGIIVGNVGLRDPTRSTLTLAGLGAWAERGADDEYGFCFLMGEDSDGALCPYAVSSAAHDAWMSGWDHLSDVHANCELLLLSRLVSI